MPQALAKKLIAADSEDTVITRAHSGKPCRVLRSAFNDAWALPGARSHCPCPTSRLSPAICWRRWNKTRSGPLMYEVGAERALAARNRARGSRDGPPGDRDTPGPAINGGLHRLEPERQAWTVGNSTFSCCWPAWERWHGPFAGIAAEADGYPDRPIRIVVPYPQAASSTWCCARRLRPRCPTHLPQRIVIENRPGADGRIGLDAVAKAPADGYAAGA